jgi:hypothetical protein
MVQARLTEHRPGLNVFHGIRTRTGSAMTLEALLIVLLISQLLVAGYLLYSFNDVEREARKRNADMRAHIDRVVADLESRLRDGAGVREDLRKRAIG